MQTLHISRQELHTRGGVLDRMLDSLFDTAILVDTDCRILYISASSFPDPSQRAAVVGQHISVLDQLSPFEEVLRTGQPRPDLFLELHGRPCISSLFPVLDGERVIGVVGTIEKGALPAQRPGRRLPGPLPGSGPGGQRLPLGGFCRGEPPGGRPAGQGPESRSQR